MPPRLDGPGLMLRKYERARIAARYTGYHMPPPLMSSASTFVFLAWYMKRSAPTSTEGMAIIRYLKPVQ